MAPGYNNGCLKQWILWTNKNKAADVSTNKKMGFKNNNRMDCLTCGAKTIEGQDQQMLPPFFVLDFGLQSCVYRILRLQNPAFTIS